MTSTPRWTPPPCSKHPLSELLRTSTIKDYPYEKHSIIQYSCAELDCEEPLGWEYQKPSGDRLIGPGQIDDSLILTVAQHSHAQRTRKDLLVILLSMMTAMVLLPYIAISTATDALWSTWHTIAIPPAAMAVAVSNLLILISRHAKRPKTREDIITVTLSNTGNKP